MKKKRLTLEKQKLKHVIPRPFAYISKAASVRVPARVMSNRWDPTTGYRPVC
jgi:hypothetical protein